MVWNVFVFASYNFVTKLSGNEVKRFSFLTYRRLNRTKLSGVREKSFPDIMCEFRIKWPQRTLVMIKYLKVVNRCIHFVSDHILLKLDKTLGKAKKL